MPLNDPRILHSIQYPYISRYVLPRDRHNSLQTTKFISKLGLSVGFPKVLNASLQVGCLGALASHGRQMTIQTFIQTLTFVPRLGVSYYNRAADSDNGVPNGSTWALSLVPSQFIPTGQHPIEPHVLERMRTKGHQTAHSEGQSMRVIADMGRKHMRTLCIDMAF
ncbi:hypothetical protein HYPSUDRAFT_342363 [Hypholoma sublateritium FD-334 SS-4]|uniref:Uncharacterized protein n=1 Tax=Hypholoma sublateritium (strain FD-334 SS-4) TaxID=945553 RepID=A0A0D2PBL3_HYPSF|nr:hypothetical protein HYPSUDRAFT_342363 [Hypholoma sublateritium FD-334 SS-4]